MLVHKYSRYSLIIKFEHIDNNKFFHKDWRESLEESITKAGESAPKLISNELSRQAWLWQVYRFNMDEDALHYRMLMELKKMNDMKYYPKFNTALYKLELHLPEWYGSIKNYETIGYVDSGGGMRYLTPNLTWRDFSGVIVCHPASSNINKISREEFDNILDKRLMLVELSK